MIVIYTPKVTNRIKYTLDFVFLQYFGITYELTENPDFAALSGNFLINYSNQIIKNSFSIFQEDLLLQHDIHPQKIFISGEQDFSVFFQTTEHYDLKFDIFSCIFYLISRYEEYLPHKKDQHGRYASANSILANKAFCFSPIVEIWLDFLKREILKIQPNIPFKNQKFEYLPIFDIDNAFQFLGRNWLKNPPDIFTKTCRNVLLKKEKDAFDTFDFILEELNRNKLKSVFFFLMNNDGKQNSNVSPESTLLHSRILKVADNNMEIGIHTSYFAVEKNLIQNEKEILESITNSTITASRQHFLKINFPDYFLQLIDAGIQTDYSLAYPDVTGFRAGCSRPFYFFNLIKNETTILLLQPTCFMDATFEYYQPEKINIFQSEFLKIFKQLSKINGKLVAGFHNDLFSGENYRTNFTFINQHSS